MQPIGGLDNFRKSGPRTRHLNRRRRKALAAVPRIGLPVRLLEAHEFAAKRSGNQLAHFISNSAGSSVQYYLTHGESLRWLGQFAPKYLMRRLPVGHHDALMLFFIASCDMEWGQFPGVRRRSSPLVVELNRQRTSSQGGRGRY